MTEQYKLCDTYTRICCTRILLFEKTTGCMIFSPVSPCTSIATVYQSLIPIIIRANCKKKIEDVLTSNVRTMEQNIRGCLTFFQVYTSRNEKVYYGPDTKNRPHFILLTSRCDLGATDLGLARDTSFHDG